MATFHVTATCRKITKPYTFVMVTTLNPTKEDLREAIQANLFRCKPGQSIPGREPGERWTAMHMIHRVTYDVRYLRTICQELYKILESEFGERETPLQFTGLADGAIPLVISLAQ